MIQFKRNAALNFCCTDFEEAYIRWDDEDDDCVVLLVKEEKYKTLMHLALQNSHRIKHTDQGEIKLVKERQ